MQTGWEAAWQEGGRGTGRSGPQQRGPLPLPRCITERFPGPTCLWEVRSVLSRERAIPDGEADAWGCRKTLRGCGPVSAPLSRGLEQPVVSGPLIIYHLLSLSGWKETLHLHRKRPRGRASEFTSEKSTDSQR